jgi:hypothetical protein
MDLTLDRRRFVMLKKYVRVAGWAGIPVFRAAVETGTYRGDGTSVLAELFSTVHTIELSPKWYEFSSQRLAGFKNVVCHQGDSAEVLERLVSSIRGPATFFLDAHFAGGETARGKDEVPLLRELEVLSRRRYADLILIDDLRLVGKTGETGSDKDPNYPPMVFDWRSVTIDRIAGVVNRNSRTHWLYEHDRIVIFRNLSWLRAMLLKTILWMYKKTGGVLRRTKRILEIDS